MLGSVPDLTHSPLPKSLLNNQFCLHLSLRSEVAQTKASSKRPGLGFKRSGNTATEYANSPRQGHPRRINLKVCAAVFPQDYICPARIIGACLFQSDCHL